MIKLIIHLKILITKLLDDKVKQSFLENKTVTCIKRFGLSCILFPVIICRMFLQLCTSEHKVSHEVQGTACRPLRHGYLEAQIWGSV